MVRLVIPARAKINLTLEVLSLRRDGYHEIRTVLQALELHDRVVLEKAEGIHVFSSLPEVPLGEANLAYRAALALRQYRGGSSGAAACGSSIFIEKNIPLAAGLAGGSADAAATLRALNELWALGLNRGELAEIGASLGSDVPFCLDGVTALATGRGEKLEPLPPLPPLHVVLAKPEFGVSTAWAYAEYDRSKEDKAASSGAAPEGPDRGTAASEPAVPRTTAHEQAAPGTAAPGKEVPSLVLSRAIQEGDAVRVGQLLHNDLAGVVSRAHPIIADLKKHLNAAGALGAEMSGSGPTVYGLFGDEGTALQAAQRLQGLVPTILVTRTWLGEWQ